MDFKKTTSRMQLWKRFSDFWYGTLFFTLSVSAYSCSTAFPRFPKKSFFSRLKPSFSIFLPSKTSPQQFSETKLVSGNAFRRRSTQGCVSAPGRRSFAGRPPLTPVLLMPLLTLLLLPGFIAPDSASAQQAPSPAPDRFSMETSIRISGNVIASTGGQNILFDTIYEVHFEQLRAGQTLITVDPITDFATADAGAGYVVAKGAPNAQFQLTFSRQVVLRHATERDNVLIVNYLLSANSTAEQENSAYVLEAAPTFRLNTDGEFHFWVGGQVDISNAIRGEYEGEFTLEVEYL